MSTLSNTKDAIKARLDTLVPDTLAAVEATNITMDPLDGDIVGFPHAFLYSPSLETADWLDNRTSQREYTFAIMVLMKAENNTSTSDVENLMETILDALEQDVTLGGAAQAGILPATSRPEAISHGDRTYIVFDVLIRARVLHELTS